MTLEAPRSILIVCLGNICRSPMAEGALRAAANKAGLDLRIDSAGTAGWHRGKPPDRRGIATARRHGVDISGQRSRPIVPDDFSDFDLILAMDADNLSDLKRCRPSGARAEIALYLEFTTDVPASVPDPYYGESRQFEAVFAQVADAAEKLCRKLANGQGGSK